jgi:APA family basic amino acid/polyamine antiporter
MAKTDNKMDRSISFFGLITLGIGCMFGTSWLLLTSGWLSRAGGPWNVVIALVLCLIVELPLAFAYLEAIGMFPLSGGELVFSYMAFGKFGGFMAAWAGILMNGIIVCWETLAIMKIMNALFPSLSNAAVLYTIGGSAITLPSIIIGLAVAITVIIIQLKGGNFSANISKITTSLIIVLVVLGISIGLVKMDATNLVIPQTKPWTEGSLSLLAILTFTIAGWETVAKSAGEARGDIGRKKVASALIICLVVCVFLNIMVVIVTSGLTPWPEAMEKITPFADAIVLATGTPIFGKLLLIAALVGVLGVSNATLYGATRMMYGLAEVGLINPIFKKLSDNKAPINCILFIGVFAVITPFIGASAFLPLVDVTAVATIAMWIMTFFSVIVMRKKYPNLERPVIMPGNKVTMVIGTIFNIFIIGTVLLPSSPGSIIWPGEYILTIALFLLGVVLYQFRDNTINTEEQRRKILGESIDTMEL